MMTVFILFIILLHPYHLEHARAVPLAGTVLKAVFLIGSDRFFGADQLQTDCPDGFDVLYNAPKRRLIIISFIISREKPPVKYLYCIRERRIVFPSQEKTKNFYNLLLF